MTTSPGGAGRLRRLGNTSGTAGNGGMSTESWESGRAGNGLEGEKILARADIRAILSGDM